MFSATANDVISSLAVVLLVSVSGGTLPGTPGVRGCAPHSASAPSLRLARAEGELRRLLERRLPDWSPEKEAQKEAVKPVLDDLLDYREIARRALGARWETVPDSQRAQFIDLLSALSGRVYVDRLAGAEPLVPGSISEQGDERTREVRITRSASGGSVSDSVFTFVREGCRWMVCDVTQGGVDLVSSYQEQFSAIVARESFDGLLERLRSKLREEERTHHGS